MKTEFYVEYNLHDTTALPDAKESTESNAAFRCSIDTLFRGPSFTQSVIWGYGAV